MNKKRTIISIILLILMYIEVCGLYLNSKIIYVRNNAFVFGIMNIVLTSVCMIIVPLLCRNQNKGKLETQKGKKICKWNSILLFIFSYILTMAIGFSIIGGIGAIIFYFINKWAFVKDIEKSKTNEKELSEKVITKDESVEYSKDKNE